MCIYIYIYVYTYVDVYIYIYTISYHTIPYHSITIPLQNNYNTITLQLPLPLKLPCTFTFTLHTYAWCSPFLYVRASRIQDGCRIPPDEYRRWDMNRRKPHTKNIKKPWFPGDFCTRICTPLIWLCPYQYLWMEARNHHRFRMTETLSKSWDKPVQRVIRISQASTVGCPQIEWFLSSSS